MAGPDEDRVKKIRILPQENLIEWVLQEPPIPSHDADLDLQLQIPDSTTAEPEEPPQFIILQNAAPLIEEPETIENQSIELEPESQEEAPEVAPGTAQEPVALGAAQEEPEATPEPQGDI